MQRLFYSVLFMYRLYYNIILEHSSNKYSDKTNINHLCFVLSKLMFSYP